MQIKVRYESFDQFFRLNKEDFKQVQLARKEMKSLTDLGLSGNAIIESEKLAYRYLNLKSLVSDLLFGVIGSVLDAKHNIKNMTAITYRELTGSAAERKIILECDNKVVLANKTYNDLLDLQTYLQNKYGDCESCHYYYKQLAQGSVK